MADKYIWHNSSALDLQSWAARFGYTSEQEVDVPADTEAYACLCQIFGCSSITPTPVRVIKRDSHWYLLKTSSSLVFHLPITAAKVHVRNRDNEHFREENINTFTYTEGSDEYGRSIAEFNYTTRLKKEGYGVENNGNISYPLRDSWNGRYNYNNPVKGQANVQQDNVNTDQNILYPFSKIKLCTIPNYLNTEDEDQNSSIIGAVYNEKVIDPTLYPIGQPLSETKFEGGFSFWYPMGYNGNDVSGGTKTINGTKRVDDYTRMWNLCLYPLVLIDPSETHGVTRRLVVSTSGGQKYIQVYAGNTPITKQIPIDPDRDFLIAYTQTASASLSSWDGNTPAIQFLTTGVQTVNPMIPQESTNVAWQDGAPSKSGCNDIHINLHMNLFIRIWLTITYSNNPNLQYYPLSTANGEVYSTNSSPTTYGWQTLNSSSPASYKKYEDLFKSITQDWSSTYNRDVPRSTTWESQDLGEKTCYVNIGSESTATRHEFILANSNDDFTEEIDLDFEECCQCGNDVYVKGKVRTMVADTKLRISGKNSFSQLPNYAEYIDYWFGDNKQYWLGNFDGNPSWYPTYERRPDVVSPGTISIDNKTEGKLSGLGINFYLDNFYAASTLTPVALEKVNMNIPVKDSSTGWLTMELVNCTVYPKTSSSGTIDTRNNDAVIVLWTHELPEPTDPSVTRGILVP